MLFIHGLYSSSGAWVSVLKHFKHHRVALVTVNYHEAILMGALPELIDTIVANIYPEFDECIAHSFGSVFLKYLNVRSVSALHIASPFVASEFEIYKYAKKISSALGYKEQDVLKVVRCAIKMSDDFNYKKSPADFFLLPSADEFFEYKSNLSSVKFFPGGHSDLDLAFDFLHSKI